MLPFSPKEIVHIWEVGRFQHPLDRALTLLDVACVEIDRSSLAALTIGQRDKLLFELREQTFGSKFNGFAECPQCRENMEISLMSEDIPKLCNPPATNFVYTIDLNQEEVSIKFRLPDSRDLAAAAGTNAAESARAVLVERCVIEASLGGETISVCELPDDIITRLAARMSESEPVADIQLDLCCPSCDKRWQQPFDIGLYFWAEIAAQTKRLLRDVHTLARAYGWSETAILSMSDARRNYYLELVIE